jgi:phage N-6-adenine-methyltransferase
MSTTDIKSKFAKTSQDYETPIDLFNKLNAEFKFDIDLAASDTNKKVMTFFSEKQDALQQDWTGKVGFLNPPQGYDGFKWEDWLAKAHDAAHTKGTTIVCLLPVRTNVKWWYKICMEAAEIRFLEKRLRFANNPNPLPQPMAIVVFKNCPAKTIYSSMMP